MLGREARLSSGASIASLAASPHSPARFSLAPVLRTVLRGVYVEWSIKRLYKRGAREIPSYLLDVFGKPLMLGRSTH